MKIMMLLPGNFPPDLRVENEIKALVNAGHKIILVCQTTNEADKSIEYEPSKSLTIYRLFLNKLIYKSSVAALTLPFYFNFWSRKLKEITSRENDIDAIHVHDLPLARLGFVLSRKLNIPFVLDLHENYPELLAISEHTNTFIGRILSPISLWKHYEKKYLKLASKIIVVVEEARDRILKIGINNEDVVIVSNTLDTSSVGQINLNMNDVDPTELFYGGGVTKHRGLQFVLKGIKLLLDRGIEVNFHIVGAGRYLEELKKLAINLGVNDHVFFYGHLKYNDMLKILAASHIAVIPHIKSGHTDSTIPHKIFQYIYFGLPILSTNCLPLVRIINETHAGLIYKFDDPVDFSEKFIELKQNINYFDPNYGRNILFKKYIWNYDANRLVDLYVNLKNSKSYFLHGQ